MKKNQKKNTLIKRSPREQELYDKAKAFLKRNEGKDLHPEKNKRAMDNLVKAGLL